jgi:hypothetical protein
MKTTMSKQLLFLAAFCCMAASVAAQTVDVTLQCGQSYTINSTVAATAATGLTYRWLENGSTVTGTATNYTVPATKNVGIYTYIRQAMSEGCTDWQNSNAFTVEVKNKDGIDGVCLGGVMWAKYNVDEPGYFTSDPTAIGKLYQFNRSVPYLSSGPCDNMETEIEETIWSQNNDPCPAGWRVPSSKELALLLNSVNTVLAEADPYSFCAENSPRASCPPEKLLYLPPNGALNLPCNYNWSYEMFISANDCAPDGRPYSFIHSRGALRVVAWAAPTQAMAVRCVAQ